LVNLTKGERYFVRIIAGKYKGKKLKFPKDNKKLRPTKDMVKEALFSIIQEKVPGSLFLDLYAGIGSIGFEALSRGAEQVYFVDTDPKFIYENADILIQPFCKSGQEENLGTGYENIHIFRGKTEKIIERLVRKNLKFDIIFIDPPYDSNEYELSLNMLERFDILKDGGLIIFEIRSSADFELSSIIFKEVKRRKYGDTTLLVLEKVINE